MKLLPNLVVTVCVLSSLVSITIAAPGECLSLRGEKREIIDARQILNQEQNVLACLTLSLQKGKVNQVRSILDLYGQQYSLQFTKAIQKELHRLELIEEDIIQGQSNCVPVVKWGQNQTHLFVATKMSHRWDSPPCLNTKHESSQISNNTFQYINVCLVSHQKITFNLTLNLYSEVKEEISMVNEGVGTFSVIIQKKSSQVWPFLVRQQTIYQIWNQIGERYNPVLAQYTELLNNKLKERRSKPVYYENGSVGDRKAKAKAKDQNETQPSEVTLQTLNELQNEDETTVKIVEAAQPVQQQASNQAKQQSAANENNQVLDTQQKQEVEVSNIDTNIENAA